MNLHGKYLRLVPKGAYKVKESISKYNATKEPSLVFIVPFKINTALFIKKRKNPNSAYQVSTSSAHHQNAYVRRQDAKVKLDDACPKITTTIPVHEDQD